MLTIRKTQESDIDFIEFCLKDKDENFANQCGYGNRFFTYPVTSEQIRNFQNARKASSIFFTIMNNDTIIGSLELIVHSEQNRCSIARFLIADEHRFKGYGSKAVQKVSEYVFNELGFNKITLTVYDFNKSALKCYLNAGFKEAAKETRENGWIAITMEKLK